MNPDKTRLIFTNKPPIFIGEPGTQVGYLSDDGIGVPPENDLPIPSYDLTTTANFTAKFTLTKRAARRMIKLITGRYRLPGDKPLIHNGKKPR